MIIVEGICRRKPIEEGPVTVRDAMRMYRHSGSEMVCMQRAHVRMPADGVHVGPLV
jgi:hypothetical protein